MKPNNTTEQTEARESDGLSACAETAQPKGTPRTCKTLGASLSITAPANCNTNQKTHPLRCAVDSLYISYKGDIKPDIEELLNFFKETAQNDDPKIASEAFLNLHDHKFQVSPKGSRQFSFVLKDNWFNIQVSKTKNSNNSKLPLAYVQISSELLTFTDLDEILSHLNKIISSLGEIKHEPTISRLDLCLDFMPKFNIESIYFKQWKTRATKTNPFYEHKKLTGWQIGSGHIMARLYNKSLEIKKSQKDYLKPLWIQNGWDGKTDVWRMEFQMRREFLKLVGLAFPHQINEYSPKVWKYLCTEWLELVTPTNDTTECRWPVTDEWKEISTACTTIDCESVKKVKKERLPNDQYLFVNGLAAISSFMAKEGITDLGEALGEYLHHAERYHLNNKDEPMAEYLAKKAKEKTLRYNTKLKE